MISRSRLLARLLHVLVACIVLGVVGAPAAPALACGDVAGWVAGASVDGASGQREREKVRGRELGASVASVAAGDEARATQAFPAGARSVFVSGRLYLRHAALLC